MAKYSLSSTFSFTWCGALQSAWSQQLLRSLLVAEASGNLCLPENKVQVPINEGVSSWLEGLSDAEKARLQWKEADPSESASFPHPTVFFWEVPQASKGQLLEQPSASWADLVGRYEQMISHLGLWVQHLPTTFEVEPCVVMISSEGRPLEYALTPWQALTESWTRSLVEQLTQELEARQVRFFSLPFGVSLEGLLERLPRKEHGSTEDKFVQEVEETDETKLLRWKIHRLVGTLREVVRLLRVLQSSIERFGFLRRQRLSQRFFKLSGLRLLDWETQFHRMITGWGHLLQVHNQRLLPPFMRDRLQADRKTAVLLQQLCSTLLHFPQEQDAPQKLALLSLRQEREILVVAIQHFLQEFEEIERLWKKQSGSLAAMMSELKEVSEQASLPQV